MMLQYEASCPITAYHFSFLFGGTKKRLLYCLPSKFYLRNVLETPKPGLQEYVGKPRSVGVALDLRAPG